MSEGPPLTLPNFLVIGAPRAGTTWIQRNLRQHPDVYMSKPKEPHFFDRHYDKGIEYYMRFFEGRKQEAAVGEATPDYLHGVYTDFDIPTLIKKHIPHAKLIASLRNPIDRIYSRYWNAKAKFPENAKLSFEEKIRLKPEFIEEGFYYDQLLRYFEIFPRDSILVLLFDDLKSNPIGFLREIFSFLGVDPNFVSGLEGIQVNAASSKKYLGKFQILWYLRRGLVRIGAHRTAGLVDKLNRTELPPMKEETRRWLVEVYREQNLQLQDLIGRDLSKWNQVDCA